MGDAHSNIDRMTNKRTRIELPDDDDSEALSPVKQVGGVKRLQKTDGYVPRFIQLPSPDVGCTSAPTFSDSNVLQVSVAVDSSVLASLEETDERLFSDSTEEECGVQAEVGDSTSGLYQACSTNFSCPGEDGLDVVFSRDPSQELLSRRASSQPAESCCGEDTQLDINSFLENWDEGVDCLASSTAADLFEGKNDDLPSAVSGTADNISVLGGDADWLFGDLEGGDKACWSGAAEQEQEWITMAVANFDKASNAFETEASVLHLLETGVGG